jgi:hypothetical protein
MKATENNPMTNSQATRRCGINLALGALLSSALAFSNIQGRAQLSSGPVPGSVMLSPEHAYFTAAGGPAMIKCTIYSLSKPSVTCGATWITVTGIAPDFSAPAKAGYSAWYIYYSVGLNLSFRPRTVPIVIGGRSMFGVDQGAAPEVGIVNLSPYPVISIRVDGTEVLTNQPPLQHSYEPLKVSTTEGTHTIRVAKYIVFPNTIAFQTGSVTVGPAGESDYYVH